MDSPTLITPTALLMAMIRRESVPYARRIATLCGAENACREFYERQIVARIAAQPEREEFWRSIDVEQQLVQTMITSFAAWGELRFWSLTNMAQRLVRPIFEIASGLSPRGLVMSDNTDVQYIESDLSEMIREKQNLVEKLLGTPRQNLSFTSFNVLGKLSEQPEALEILPEGPITIINEGLLGYFPHEQIQQAATNIHHLLSFVGGGVWATTDILLKDWYRRGVHLDELTKLRMELVREGTQRDMADNAFNSYEQAEQMMHRAGFTVEKHLQLDLVAALASPVSAAVREGLKSEVVWVMTPR